MEKLYKLITLISLIFIFNACGGSRKATDYKLIEDKYCHLTELNYQEVTDTIHRTQNGNVEGGVMVNGKAVISDKISLDSVRATLNAGNKVFLDQKTMRTVKVSQEYYQNFNKMRAAMCNLVQGMKDGIISSDEFKTKAGEQYLQINALFAGLPQQEKKSPN